MRTASFIALAILCAVSVRAQQATEADGAKAAVRIRAIELQRRSPNGSNTVVASTPQPIAAPVTPPMMLPGPIVAAPPSAAVPASAPVSATTQATAPTVTGEPPAALTPMASTTAVTAAAATDPDAKEAPPQDKSNGDDSIDFEFMNTDIQQVIAFYAQLTRRSAIMQQGLTATITLPQTPKLTVEEAIGAVESVLLINGFAIIPMGDKFFKVVPSPYGPQEGMPVFTEDAKLQQFDRLVAQVVRVKFLDPTDVARALGGSGGGAAVMPGAPQPTPPGGATGAGRVFMHPYGQIIPLPRSSALLLIDTALNVSRLKQVIEYMDTTSETKMETRVYVMENADAAAVYAILQQLIAADQGSTTPGQTGQIMPQQGSMGFVVGRSRPSVASIEESVIMGRVLINYDLRTNAIILITQEVNFAFFEKIIKALDVRTNQDFKTRVFFLNYADAIDMADVLFQLIQGAEPQAVSSRSGRAGGSPYTSRTGAAATTGGRTTGLGGSTSGARGSGTSARSSSGGSRSSATSRSGSSRRSTASRSTTGATRSTTPMPTATPGAAGANPNVPQQFIEIIPDVRNNALVVFAPEQDLESLADVIKQLDVFPPQVAIDCVVAEVNVDKDTTFGVDLFQKGMGKGAAGGGVSTPGGGLTGTTTIRNANSTNVSDVITRMINPTNLTAPEMLPAGLTGGLTYFARFFGDDLRAVITALSGDSKFKVLQTPHLYTSNNQTARVFVGRTIPVVTSTQTTINSDQTRSNYENVDVGVGLEVTPLINPDGVVTFNVYQTYDNVRLDTVKIDQNNVPTFDRREAEAVAVTCKDGQIIIMGGLTTNDREQQENKVPVLGDIPVFGYLFKKTEWKETKRELVFFLRPKVIRTIEEAQRYTWGRIEKSKDLRTLPLRDVEGYSPMQDKRHNEKLKAIDRFDKSEKF
jgi:general secretion pathway protein D